MVRAYCVNIAFYLRLRAKAVPSLNDHPVIGRLAQLKTLIDRLTSEKTNDFAVAYLEMYESERAKESAFRLIFFRNSSNFPDFVVHPKLDHMYQSNKAFIAKRN